MYIIDKTKRSSRLRNNRYYDYQELRKSLNSNDPGARKTAEQGIDAIKKEDKYVASMRESLIKAHRQGNTSEIRDINEYVASHKKYRHE